VDNIVEFKTGERPLCGNQGYNYNRLIKSLLALKDTTKCVILERDEITNNQITMLRKHMRKNHWGWVKCCKQDGKIHLWAVNEGRE
jgi:hypothetical protein